MQNIVIIGGGTGTSSLLKGLRKYPVNNTVIVASSDDGGSTGKLRKELGVFPPGDLRQCLLGLSYTSPEMSSLFSYRFDQGSLKGHTVGNIILAALEKTSGNIEHAVETAAKMLNVRGAVLPVSLNATSLTAVFKNGKKVQGEHNIDEPKKLPNSSIAGLRITKAKTNPKALAAIKSADVIIFGPGDLYTSLLPNVLVKGVRRAIVASKAKKVLVTNLMTKAGQTDNFKVKDFVSEIEKYISCKIDVILVNTKKPSAKFVSQYLKEHSRLVEPELEEIKNKNFKVLSGDFLSSEKYRKASGDVLVRSVLRHDSDKIAKAIWQLIA